MYYSASDVKIECPSCWVVNEYEIDFLIEDMEGYEAGYVAGMLNCPNCEDEFVYETAVDADYFTDPDRDWKRANGED